LCAKYGRLLLPEGIFMFLTKNLFKHLKNDTLSIKDNFMVSDWMFWSYFIFERPIPIEDLEQLESLLCLPKWICFSSVDAGFFSVGVGFWVVGKVLKEFNLPTSPYTVKVKETLRLIKQYFR